MRAEPLFRAAEWVYHLPDAEQGITQHAPPPEALTADLPEIPRPTDTPIILMTPQGRLLTHDVAAELAANRRLMVICGHYEGVDERVREHLVTDEISIGDY